MNAKMKDFETNSLNKFSMLDLLLESNNFFDHSVSYHEFPERLDVNLKRE